MFVHKRFSFSCTGEWGIQLGVLSVSGSYMAHFRAVRRMCAEQHKKFCFYRRSSSFHFIWGIFFFRYNSFTLSYLMIPRAEAFLALVLS